MTRFIDQPHPSNFAPLKDPLIYLVPPSSTRYIFRRKRLDSQPVETSKTNILRIENSRQMIDFLVTYATNLVLDGERHGVIDWVKLQSLYEGIEFKWYRHFSRCSHALRECILQLDLMEFYANLTEKCGYWWFHSTNQTLS